MDQASKDAGSMEHHSLSKHLGVRDLTAFGIAAIIGAGILVRSETRARMADRA